MRKSIVYTLIACLLVSSLPFSVTADANDDIPTNAAGTGIHDSLVAALTQADLVTTLQGTGPFTVFAPTDQAFADAGIDLTTFDTDEENATLVDILTYHVVSGKVMSTDLTDGMEAAALNQDTLTFSVSSSEVKVNDAVVTLADVESSNGVIHVIDKVLMPPADPVYVDIPATAQSTGIHTALVAALSQANLVTALQSEGPFTVFAPTDQAFTDAGIDLTTFDTDEEIATLVDILTYHVYSGAVPSSAVTDGLAVTMFNGDKASFAVGTDGTVTIGDATVTGADVQTSNGIIHVIDKVLMPPAGDICYTMVSHTIVPGATNLICNSYMYVEDYTVGGQTITGCYNTVTHAVSDVSAAICGAYMWTPAVNLAMTAGATTIHTSLVAALTAADLVTTLSGETEYTVFAPSDDAFAAAGIDLDSFDTPEEIAVLTDILLYHVVAGTTLSTDLAEGMTTVSAANSDDLTIHVANGAVMVGTAMANVTLADVPASNGVIHVIDQVLMPPADATPDPFDGVTCAVTIGLTADGYGFSPAIVNIENGQTVCWSWTDAAMGHNVKEIDGAQSSTFVANGVTSGAAATTVAFHHTFTGNQTFYYACEPHISMNMFGEVVVGDGGVEPTSDDDDDENTPGFMASTMILAALGAILFMGRRRSL
ncbi:MAG: hypothetical protein HOM85_04010 [Euryarchaeota archaeon]|nr:hypothetical protein [Euryarchaeota archaeon]MBT5281683.1 hypothetical protein [Euryarchaeota archaeon]